MGERSVLVAPPKQPHYISAVRTSTPQHLSSATSSQSQVMTGPRFAADELVHKERRRDFNIASMSSRVRALELQSTVKHIAAERSQTQCLFRRRREELLCAMKHRVQQLERQAHIQQLASDSSEMVALSRQQLQAESPRATDPYPVSFGRVHQKTREDELLVQYHGRRRKSYEFEDAASVLRGRVAAQSLQQHRSFRGRRLSKEFEDLPPPAAQAARPPPVPAPPRERPPLRLAQRRKSGEFEDIRFGQQLLSPLLQRRRKSKEFEDAVLFRRPPTRRAFASTPDDHVSSAGGRDSAPSGEQLRRQPHTHQPPPQPLLPHRRAPTPMPPASPKSPRGTGQRHKVRITYPVDKIVPGPAEFTTIHEVGGRGGAGTPDDGHAAAAGKSPFAAESRSPRSLTYVISREKEPEQVLKAEEQEGGPAAGASSDAVAKATAAAAAAAATAIVAAAAAVAAAPSADALSAVALETVVAGRSADALLSSREMVLRPQPGAHLSLG